MLRNILIASFLIGSACAVYLEYLKVDSNDLTDGTLISGASHGSVDEDEDLAVHTEKSVVCFFCKKVMKSVKKHISNRDNVEKIREKLKRGCDKIKIKIDLCKKLVDKHIGVLVKELFTDDAPKTICVKAGMCKPKGMLELMQVFPPNLQLL